MAYECIDVATIKQTLVFCQWEEDGVPEEHVLEIVHLKKLMQGTFILLLWNIWKRNNLKVAELSECILMEQV